MTQEAPSAIDDATLMKRLVLYITTPGLKWYSVRAGLDLVNNC